MPALFPTTGFSIGTLKLGGRVVMAPLAGVTDRVFRQICRDEGAALCITEMVSADGLVRKNRKTLDMLETDPGDHPLGVQLFGSDPEVITDGALIVEESGADLVDLNFGCPVKKVVKRGAGAAVLGDLPRMRRILRKVVAAVGIPVTIKIRTGITVDKPVALEAAKLAQDEGVQAVGFHPRSLKQGFSGTADWDQITHLVENVNIPILGSGDVFTVHDAIRMVQQTGCQAVMVARGAMGNTHLIRQIHAAFQGDHIPDNLRPTDRLDALLRFFDLAIEGYGARRGVPRMRTPITWYVRGMPGAAAFRRDIVRCNDPDDVRRAILDFRHRLTSQIVSQSGSDSR
jgi:tRNA-dihydrouridine synthase B